MSDETSEFTFAGLGAFKPSAELAIECEVPPAEVPPVVPSWSWTIGEDILLSLATCLRGRGFLVPLVYMGSGDAAIPPGCCDLLYGYWQGGTVRDSYCKPMMFRRRFIVLLSACRVLPGELFPPEGRSGDPRVDGIALNSQLEAMAEAVICCPPTCSDQSCAPSTNLIRWDYIGDRIACHIYRFTYEVEWMCNTAAPPSPRISLVDLVG